MSDTVIRVENLFKEYRLGTIGHGTLRHDLASWWANVRGKDDPNSLITPSGAKGAISPALRQAQCPGEKKDLEELKSHFLALNDVSFEVKAGEVLGIIGRNGAGKSTLLKILSRVTAPSAGTIKIKGRMASLLEVGTGFHPELTGRENTYMNGAILGMRRHEIAKKMDEIVAFAELEKFIDTPVKRYSSGMYVRLAFAIAAHLDAEILVMDEVLAVGDATFQKKCLGKMDDVAKNQGRTVLFVSHNMGAVRGLCSQGLLLTKGAVTSSGIISKVLNTYVSSNFINNAKNYWDDLKKAPGNDLIRIRAFDVSPLSGDNLTVDSGVVFKIEFINYKPNILFDVTFELSTMDGVVIFHSGKGLSQKRDAKTGTYVVQGELPPYSLNAGRYKFKVMFGEGLPRAMFMDEDIGHFELIPAGSRDLPGILYPDLKFKAEYLG